MPGSVGTAGKGTMARRKDGGFLLGLALSMTLLEPAPGRAEVATDGTLGAKVRLTSRDVKIPARLGQTRGQNLFHSFERFGVETGNKVTFTTPDRLKLKNVIGRVTGGEPSTIDGVLASEVRGADLWLLNPAGILFGPNARLDVQGSFHASTADELRFADGAVFGALDPQGSVLSVAAPEAFGFLGARPAGITVDRSVLEVPTGKALSLVGGDLAIRGNNDGIVNDTRRTDEPGTVRAPAGRITLAALDGPGAVAIRTGEATGAVTGNIHLTGEASVIASSNGGGTVRIRGGRIVVNNGSWVVANNTGVLDAAAGVTVAANMLEVSNSSRITADALGAGNAGPMMIQADQLELRDSGQISQIASYTLGPGDAGEVMVTADQLTVDGGGQISNYTLGPSDAGRVTVQADQLEIRGGGQIAGSTFGPSDAGQVVVRAGRLLVDGGGLVGLLTGIASNAPSSPAGGNAGRVTVQADTLEIRGGGQIASSTLGPGDAGQVVVRAGRLLVDGGGLGLLTAIASDTYSRSAGGDAGRVTVRADQLEVRGDGLIVSNTVGAGNAGEVLVSANHMTMANGGAVETNSTSAGQAGDVSVQAGHLTVRDGGLIGSSATGSGPAGNLHLDASTLEVEDASIRTESKVSEGGQIEVTASDLISLEDAEVTSSGIKPEAGASVITLEAPLIALNASRVTSLTGSGVPLAGSGLAQLLGEVTVISPGSFVAASSTVTLTGAEGDIGSQLVVPEGVFLNVGDLLRESCAARRSGAASSFTAMGRGGRLPDPAGSLAGSYREQSGATAADQAGPVLAASFGEGCKTAPGG
jgi:filamentous hemagglutinin family protein